LSSPGFKLILTNGKEVVSLSIRRTIVALFNGSRQAVDLVKALNEKELANNQISLITPRKRLEDMETAAEVAVPGIDALEGWLVQIDDIDIPGVGRVTAGGPFAGAIGQGDKNISDILTYYGVAASRAKVYQEEVKRGKILAVIETNNDKASETANLMEQMGGHKVTKWSKNKNKWGKRS